MSRDEFHQTIRSYIADEILEGEAVDLTDDTPLLEHGIIDSMSVIMLVSHIKKVHRIEIPPTELTATNFKSVGTICDLLERLTK